MKHKSYRHVRHSSGGPTLNCLSHAPVISVIKKLNAFPTSSLPPSQSQVIIAIIIRTRCSLPSWHFYSLAHSSQNYLISAATSRGSCGCVRSIPSVPHVSSVRAFDVYRRRRRASSNTPQKIESGLPPAPPSPSPSLAPCARP